MQLSGGLYSASAALLPVRLSQIDEWIYRLRTFIICHVLIIQCITHLLALCFVSFLNATKKFIERKINLFFIVKNCGGSSSSSCVCNECLGSPCVFVDPRCICI